MKPIWIIAICEIIRTVQLSVDIVARIREGRLRKNAYEEFVSSLKISDRQYMIRLLKQFEKKAVDRLAD